jgi:hypothetical protein
MERVTASSHASPAHQLGPVPLTKKSPPPLSLPERQFQAHVKLWENVLKLFLKIPILQKLFLFLWKKSLKGSASIEKIPSYLPEELAEECFRVQFQSHKDLIPSQQLPYLDCPEDCIETLEESVKKNTSFTLGEFPPTFSHGKQKTLSPKFIEVFSPILTQDDCQIRTLIIHSSFKQMEDLSALCNGIQANTSIEHLTFNLNTNECQHIFHLLPQIISHKKDLKSFALKNCDMDSDFVIGDLTWLKLSSCLEQHRDCTFTFSNIPEMPEKFLSPLKEKVNVVFS